MPRLSRKCQLEQGEGRRETPRRAAAQAPRARLNQAYAISRGPAVRILVLLLATGMLGFGVFAGYRTVVCIWRWQDALSWVFVIGFTMLALPVFIMYLASFDSTGARKDWVRRHLPVLRWPMHLSENPSDGMRIRSGLWFWWFPVLMPLLVLILAGTTAARAVPQRAYVELLVGLVLITVFPIVIFRAVHRLRARQR